MMREGFRRATWKTATGLTALFVLGCFKYVFALIGVSLASPLIHAQAPAQTAEPPKAEAPMPEVPKGVEVLARGPIHEAYATPTHEPEPTKPVPKVPPKPIDELPPADKPEGEVVWIGGYWAWDDDRKDFLWVSGLWRSVPPGKKWVAGYWKEEGAESRWVPGFWLSAEAKDGGNPQVNYLPAPPKAPEVAAPGQPPNNESFFVPGSWVWRDAGYMPVNGVQVWHDAGYVWTAGYWARVQPGYVWVPAHFRWTPGGHVYIPGYWDLALANRGVLYAPVVVNYAVVGPGFVYTPAYVIRDTVVVESLFVRPCYCHYYFGDYYGPVYRDLGYESSIIYSRRHYDAIIVYERYHHRYDPAWEAVHVELTLGRHAGRYPLPPRTLVQQRTVVNNITNVTVNVNGTPRTTSIASNQAVVSSSRLAADKGVRTVNLDTNTRLQAHAQAASIRDVSQQRFQSEAKPALPGASQVRTATLGVAQAKPVTMPGENIARAPVVASRTTGTGTLGGPPGGAGAAMAAGARPGLGGPPAGSPGRVLPKSPPPASTARTPPVLQKQQPKQGSGNEPQKKGPPDRGP